MTTPDEVKRRIFEAIGAYSVGVSQTGICAPTVEMVAEIESAIDALAAQAAPAQPLVNDTFAVDWLTNRAELHPLTANLVVRFARALAAKLAAAEKKYGYTDGWRDQNWMDECRAKLVEHIAKGDPRDVAAYCAFLWHHGESTAGAQAAPAAQPSSEFERGRQLGIEQERALWELAAQSQELGLYHDAALQAAQPVAWQPIETAPQTGFMLVHEDGAIRALMRIDGEWHKPGYPALVTTNHWQDVLVGPDAERVLAPLGYRLEHRDGCCENPTHWMPPLPPPQADTQPSEPAKSQE